MRDLAQHLSFCCFTYARISQPVRGRTGSTDSAAVLQDCKETVSASFSVVFKNKAVDCILP